MSLPCASKSPPSCGVVSSEILDIALDVARPDTKLDRVIFFKPPQKHLLPLKHHH